MATNPASHSETLGETDLARLIEHVESLDGQRVLLVGDWILDRYVYGDTERISPEAPVPVLKVVNREFRAGGRLVRV